MRTRDEVTTEKLRGGFYSPEPLVNLCLERIRVLTRGRGSLRVLEPSAGDGAFVRGIARDAALSRRVATICALELLGAEAARCASELEAHGLPGVVQTTSAISWGAASDEQFDVAVGNPPFVRFQFVPSAEKQAIRKLEQRLGFPFAGVSNLWLPVLLAALNRLSTGGAFSFIVPAECFTGISAGVLRQWLVQNTARLRFDLFPPGSFPDVLQEVVILSGQRKLESTEPAECEIHERRRDSSAATATHSIPPSRQSWTRYLLNRAQLDALNEAEHLSTVWTVGTVAKFEVAAVTGANEYFSVSPETLECFGLQPWALPLLPRIRHARGLRYTPADHDSVEASGAKTHLLDFSSDRPDPTEQPGAASYLALGVQDGLPARFKCRIRSPWYRVPQIRPGRLMLSKRSHRHPRVVLNEACVVTTDTIYRGATLGFFQGREADLTAAFHNSLTLLSAEVEGRSFGGGVLELVPSEIGRLLMPMPDGFGAELDRLDAISRSQASSEDNETLVEETNRLLTKADVGLTADLLDSLRSGREELLQRRLNRNALS